MRGAPQVPGRLGRQETGGCLLTFQETEQTSFPILPSSGDWSYLY